MKKSARIEESVEQELTERQRFAASAADYKDWIAAARQQHMALQCMTLLYCIRTVNHTCPKGVTE